MFPNGVRVTPTEACYKKNEYFFLKKIKGLCPFAPTGTPLNFICFYLFIDLLLLLGTPTGTPTKGLYCLGFWRGLPTDVVDGIHSEK